MNEKIKVLIGDDSAEFGLTWASMIKKEGMFSVARHKNGKIILDSVLNDMPDFLIILYSDTGDRTADVGQGGR